MPNGRLAICRGDGDSQRQPDRRPFAGDSSANCQLPSIRIVRAVADGLNFRWNVGSGCPTSWFRMTKHTTKTAACRGRRHAFRRLVDPIEDAREGVAGAREAISGAFKASAIGAAPELFFRCPSWNLVGLPRYPVKKFVFVDLVGFGVLFRSRRGYYLAIVLDSGLASRADTGDVFTPARLRRPAGSDCRRDAAQLLDTR